MTNSMIDFQDLIEKSTDGDWLREMISFAAMRLQAGRQRPSGPTFFKP